MEKHVHVAINSKCFFLSIILVNKMSENTTTKINKSISHLPKLSKKIQISENIHEIRDILKAQEIIRRIQLRTIQLRTIQLGTIKNGKYYVFHRSLL